MRRSLPSNKVMPEEQALLSEFLALGDPDDMIPRLARDRKMIQRIEAIVRGLETSHELVHGDARVASALDADSVHLVVTSPPYWTLKRYNEHDEQLGHFTDYDEFMDALDEVVEKLLSCSRARRAADHQCRRRVFVATKE